VDSRLTLRLTLVSTNGPDGCACVRRRVCRRVALSIAAGDPNASPERRRKLANARTENAKAIREWEAAHPVRRTPRVFLAMIWPELQGVTPQAVRETTGLSISYCRRVLRGQYMPHPMHWDTIRRLIRKK